MPNLRRLTTVREVIDVLGGIPAVMLLTCANLKAVYHWTNVGTFPARNYALMQRALKRRGYRAPPTLWNQIGFNKEAA